MKIVPIRLIVLFAAFLALYIGLQIAISFGLHAMGVHGPVASAALARDESTPGCGVRAMPKLVFRTITKTLNKAGVG